MDENHDVNDSDKAMEKAIDKAFKKRCWRALHERKWHNVITLVWMMMRKSNMKFVVQKGFIYGKVTSGESLTAEDLDQVQITPFQICALHADVERCVCYAMQLIHYGRGDWRREDVVYCRHFHVNGVAVNFFIYHNEEGGYFSLYFRD